MKLESLSFCGYKSFPGGDTDDGPLDRLDLAPLTLLFGKNNSGKSAVARLPRLLLGSLTWEDERILPLEVRGVKYGARFVDLIHGGDFFRRPTFAVAASHGAEKLDLSVTLYSPDVLAKDDPPKLWAYEMRSPESIRQAPRTEGLRLAGLLPEGERWGSWRSAASALLDRMVHLGPMRAPIKPSYEVERPARLGLEGAEAPQWLRAHPELGEQVGAWLEANMEGWRLSVSRSNESFSLRISRTSALNTNLSRAGEGLQQALPVVMHQLWRQGEGSEEGFLDVVEQPELHLHDAAQAPLADLFIETALQGRGTVVVETHSEPLLLRAQRRVAEGAIPPDSIALYFVEINDDGSKLRRITIDRDGEVDWWPSGVFEEDFHEVAALRRAQRLRSDSDDRP